MDSPFVIEKVNSNETYLLMIIKGTESFCPGMLVFYRSTILETGVHLQRDSKLTEQCFSKLKIKINH